MVAVGRRPGHSLPELIVAVVFLATTAAAVGSLALVGARRTAAAARQQVAVRTAEVVLDSVLAEPPVVPGAATYGPHVARWTPDGASGARVTVTGLERAVRVTLYGRTRLAVPVLPDEAMDSVAAFVAGSPP